MCQRIPYERVLACPHHSPPLVDQRDADAHCRDETSIRRVSDSDSDIQIRVFRLCQSGLPCEWKGTLVEENYTDPVYDPAEVGRLGDDVSDATFNTMGLISSDPNTHVRKIKAMQQLGATAIVIMNISGRDPIGMLRT